MIHKVAKVSVALYFVCSILSYGASSASAAVPYAYEPISGTNGSSMNTNSGSVSSNGFIGNWAKVEGTKQPYDLSQSTYFKSGLTFAYPTNSRYTVPTGNTAAASDWSLWVLNYNARRLVTPISFDASGTIYMSYLINVATSSGGNGSAMVGLIETMTTSSADSGPQSLLVGYTYNSRWTVEYQAANAAVWNDSAYDAASTNTVVGNASGSSYLVVTKFTTAASGNDRVQVKSYAPTDNLPASDSSISWDVDYQTPITGTMRFAAIQLEYQTAVDELRFATSYVNAVGLPESATLSAPTISGAANKGVTTNIQVTSNSTGKVRFLVDGKRIPGCLAVSTSGTAPNFTATCPWKAPVKGSRTITAQLISSDSLFTNTSSTSRVDIAKRTTTR